MFNPFVNLIHGVFIAARRGQLLPILTVVLALLSVLSLFLESKYLRFFMKLLLVIASIGYILLCKLYSHSIRTIFNRQIPGTITQCIPSFIAHLSLLKPLEIIYRCITYRWRVLPDIIVLGEVRCGTTSLCQHLSSLPHFDCHSPFCLWKHPELDRKETFFFVGHYLRYVTPKYYRMCFPLSVERWWSLQKCRKFNSSRPFVTFDGCAQYLTSPTAPYLIAEAYRQANLPPPVLIACVRDPLEQAISWWQYENAAMEWGKSMGLNDFNASLRTDQYPPRDINSALEYSLGSNVNDLYQNANELYSSELLQKLRKENIDLRLPEWAMTWPGGQLTGIGRNAKYSENINRYERVFGSVFGKRQSRYVTILPLEVQNNGVQMHEFLSDMLQQVSDRVESPVRSIYEKAVLEQIKSMTTLPAVHRNALIHRKQMDYKLSEKYNDFFKKERETLHQMLCIYNE